MENYKRPSKKEQIISKIKNLEGLEFKESTEVDNDISFEDSVKDSVIEDYINDFPDNEVPVNETLDNDVFVNETLNNKNSINEFLPNEDSIEEIPIKRGFKVPEHRLTTEITEVKPNNISTRGFNQVDLISNLNYAEMVFLILKGRLPKDNEAKIFNHILVSFVDHGVTPPSTQSARLIASSGSPLNNAVAGGLLSFGKNHAGAIEKSMNLLQKGINSLNLENVNPKDVNRLISRLAIDIVNKYEKKSEKIPGFGHRYHDKDPRAVRLIDLAILESAIGPHTKLVLVIESILSERKGICLNVDGANAGLLSDLGFDPKLGLGIFMIGRLPGLVAHSYEEMKEEDKFRRFCDLEDIMYEGLKNQSFK